MQPLRIGDHLLNEPTFEKNGVREQVNRLYRASPVKIELSAIKHYSVKQYFFILLPYITRL